MASNQDGDDREWGVVTAPDSNLDWSGTEASIFEWRADETSQADFADWLDPSFDPVVIDGDDRTVGAVVTARVRQRSPGDTEVRFCPLRTDGFDTIASAVDGPEREPDVPGRLDERVGSNRWRATQLPSIRTTPSTEAASQYGFNFGAGAVFALFELRYRAGDRFGGWRRTLGEWARKLVSSRGETLFEPETCRMTIDYEPRGETLGFLLASALETSWFGWSFDADGPRWQGGESGSDFIREAARARTLPSFVRGESGHAFDRIHIDWTGGYVLDGELYDPDVPYVLQLAPGPQITFVR